MGYNNTKREAQSALNKKKIVQTARELILLEGYDNVSVSKITKTAGVSKGAFYIHFDSKEDVLNEIIDLVFSSYKKEINIDDDIYENIANYLKNSCKAISKHGIRIMQSWFADAAKGSLYANKKVNYDKEYVKGILMSKYSDEEAEIHANKVIAIHYGVLLMWCISNGKIDVNKLIESIL